MDEVGSSIFNLFPLGSENKTRFNLNLFGAKKD